MGQAKKRGTFEERMARAVVRDEQARLDKLAADLEIERNMTPEERARKKEARRKAAMILAVASGLTLPMSMT